MPVSTVLLVHQDQSLWTTRLERSALREATVHRVPLLPSLAQLVNLVLTLELRKSKNAMNVLQDTTAQETMLRKLEYCVRQPTTVRQDQRVLPTQLMCL